ncbi:hypothetical protein M5K25_027778 [Dendrobium thyrsiflorum]|uniref:PHD-type domain-containing protein n=1 Tax=Dendrobium thyrsiflorum TaxID=117978 RepID=A0ABD0TUR9_DENTH
MPSRSKPGTSFDLPSKPGPFHGVPNEQINPEAEPKNKCGEETGDTKNQEGRLRIRREIPPAIFLRAHSVAELQVGNCHKVLGASSLVLVRSIRALVYSFTFIILADHLAALSIFWWLNAYCYEIHECSHNSKMRAPVKKLIGYKSRNYFANEENSKTVSMPLNQKGFKVANNKRYYLTPGFRKKRACKRKNNLNGKPIETPQKKSDCNIDKRIGSFKLTRKRTCFSVGKNSKNLARSSEKKSARRRRLKGRKKIIVLDEVSRMQRRASYLLIKMKLEQTLIDAYSGDGWKGQSREKIKPEKELQRAQRQILKCKLGIRDSIHQLDLLGSEGRIEDSVMNPDGSVFHEHIFCAKCKSREAFPDNDIILCDGNCNCGFHQKCLEPPLDKIPPGDQGWLCKICNCKMEILETINAHLSTCFTVNSSWEDIFKEAVFGPDAEGACSNLVEDWPSDDSEDEDYCPDNNTAEFEENFSDDACSSVDSIFSSDASLNFVNCLGSDESGDEITSYRRQRRDVDYRKLYDEMFGKEPIEGTEQSEDEDWGPYRKKKARIASDVGITSTDGENKDSHEKTALGDAISCNKRSIFRIPPDAIEKLRQIFDENELPSRTVKENLSKQLGISVEKILQAFVVFSGSSSIRGSMKRFRGDTLAHVPKEKGMIPLEEVDKWFKNARYAAIKIRKAEASNQLYHISDVPIVDEGHRRRSDTAVSLDSSCLLPLASIFHLPRHKKKIHRTENLTSASFPAKKQKEAATTVHSNAIQARSQLRNAVWLKKHTITRDRDLTSTKITAIVPEADKTYINEMQMLCVLERRLHQLKQRLLACKDYNEVQAKKLSGEEAVIYVPVAENIIYKYPALLKELLHNIEKFSFRDGFLELFSLRFPLETSIVFAALGRAKPKTNWNKASISEREA